MTARLHVLLGGGGVGKTTLAVAYALALARGGRRVGLLGIDPSRRLQDALGVTLGDLDVPIEGSLRAAIVQPHQAIRRWAAEASTDPDAAARLEANPFFAALGDRLASATDVIAAARIAEWAERDPAVEDLVIDTAPGVAAVEFVRAPRQLEALVRGRLIGWLRAAARGGGGWSAGRRVLDSFARIAGARMVIDLADLFARAQAPLERMLARVSRARGWLASDATELLLVTSPHDTGARGAAELSAALAAERLVPAAVIVNRAHPPELAAELAVLAIPPGAEPFVAHTRARLAAQAQVIAAARAWAPALITLPSSPAIAGTERAALLDLGRALERGLHPLDVRSAS